MREKTILLAEDDVFVREIYCTRLENEGYTVVAVSDGREAMEYIQQHIPDAIVLDIMMPRMDGIEVLKALKENKHWKDIPVLLLTNISEREQIREALQLGAKEYLIKSHFTPSEIVMKVNILFGEKI